MLWFFLVMSWPLVHGTTTSELGLPGRLGLGSHSNARDSGMSNGPCFVVPIKEMRAFPFRLCAFEMSAAEVRLGLIFGTDLPSRVRVLSSPPSTPIMEM